MPPPAVIPDEVANVPPFLVELFSSGEGITKASQAIGLGACSLSFYGLNISFGNAVPVDLTQMWSQQLVVDLIQCKSSAAILWAAPPSGTLSRARERPIKRQWAQAGVPSAPQLRSTSQPEGLSSAMNDKTLASQLEAANKLIYFTFRAVETCISEGKPWFIQNPRNSYLWYFPFWSSKNYYDVDFDQCEYGAPRPNPLRIRSSTDWLASLGARCTNTHTHKPWQPAVLGQRFMGFPGDEAKGLPPKFAEWAAAIVQGKYTCFRVNRRHGEGAKDSS